MKKSIVLILLLGIQSVNAYQTFGPMLFSSLFLNETGCKVTIAPTFSWWRIRKSLLHDVSGNRDFVANNYPKVVPGVCVSIDREIHRFESFKSSTRKKRNKKQPFFKWLFYGKQDKYKEVEEVELFFQTIINMGLRFNYQKRHKACIADFFEEGNASSDFRIEQDVHNIRLTPYCQAEFDFKKFMVSISAAPSIHFKTFGSLEIWEKLTNAYTGQRLEPDKVNLLAEFDTGLKFPCKDYGHFTFNYSLTAGAIRYGRKIHIDQPGDNASEEFEDQLFLTDKDSIYTARTPKLKILAHSFSVGFEKEF